MDNFKPIGATAVNVMVRLAEVPILRPRYPGVAVALAHHMARREVERQLRAQGLRPVHVPYVRILALMQAYKAAHQEELLAQAMERVSRDPKLRAMAERELRELEREQRKRARNGVLEKPANRSV
jgi:hypothetical protein